MKNDHRLCSLKCHLCLTWQPKVKSVLIQDKSSELYALKILCVLTVGEAWQSDLSIILAREEQKHSTTPVSTLTSPLFIIILRSLLLIWLCELTFNRGDWCHGNLHHSWLWLFNSKDMRVKWNWVKDKVATWNDAFTLTILMKSHLQ